MSLLDTLLSGQLLFAALVTGSLYALVGLGLNLVYGTMRMLNVAHGDVVTPEKIAYLQATADQGRGNYGDRGAVPTLIKIVDQSSR